VNRYRGDLQDIWDYLIPKDDHFATSLILNINLLIYLLMILSGTHFLYPSADDLLRWGASMHNITADGQWWRLLTNTFLHGGFMHLLLNIYALVIAGIYLEPVLGRVKYFIVYLASAICGSLASFWWYENTVTIGASGAIFGLFGATLSLLLTDAYLKQERKSIFSLLGIYVGISLLWGLTGGIDNAAHIGGLASGAVIGSLLYMVGRKKNRTIN
jgi:rhomboid protease GluP